MLVYEVCSLLKGDICSYKLKHYNEPYLLNVGANHILDVFHNTVRLPLYIFCKKISQYLMHHKIQELSQPVIIDSKDVSISCLPTATLVSPGRSMSVKLTTAKVQEVAQSQTNRS